MAKHNYPYLNTNLKSMPGERWKDVPGLEDLYQVSSMGRVKRLERSTKLKNKTIYPRAEMIIKPEVRTSYNAYKKDYSKYLSVRLAVDEVRYNYSLARLVLTTFKPSMVYEDKTKVIVSIDEDTLNVRLSNLKAISVSEKQQRMKDMGRSPSPFHKLSARQVKQRWLHMLRGRYKPIIQYSLSGKKIAEFENIALAAKATGANRSAITQTAKGNQLTSGGFKWKYKNNKDRSS
jgi:hypothetical protein